MNKWVSSITGKPILKRKRFGDYNTKLKREKNWLEFHREKDWLEFHFILNTSRMPALTNRELYWAGKQHKHQYGQYCMWCGNEFEGVSWIDGKLSGVRIFVEKRGYAPSIIHFLCSKKCYDALSVSKKRHPYRATRFTS